MNWRDLKTLIDKSVPDDKEVWYIDIAGDAIELLLIEGNKLGVGIKETYQSVMGKPRKDNYPNE